MLRKFAILITTRDMTEPDCLDVEDVVNTLFDNLDRSHVIEVLGRDDTDTKTDVLERDVARRTQ